VVKDYDKLLYRLTSILTKLSNSELPTVRELADEYNVSVRTIQRDVYERLSGFPVVANEQKKLQFIDGFTLNRTKLSLEEITTMTLSLELIKNKGNEFQEASLKLMNKFLYKDVFNPYYIKPVASEKIDTDSHILNQIEEAIQYKNVILIVRKNKTEKEIEPIKITNYDGFWYLLGKSDGSIFIDMISHMISQIVRVEILSTKYHMSESEYKLFENVHTPFFKEDVEFPIVIKVKSNVANYFKLKKFLPSQEILEEYEDGSIKLKFKVTHLEEIDNLVKSFLPDIIVLEPQEYRESILKEIKEYIENYK